MSRNLIETIMGAVVLVVAAIFLIFAYGQADLGKVKGYTLTAEFSGAGGLTGGSDVRINGVKVGSVLDQKIDPNTYLAVVRMSIRPDIRLPKDTVVSIGSEGLLGGHFVQIDPGHSKDMIPPDGQIGEVKNYRSLEELVGEVIFLATDGGPKGAASGAGGAAPAGGGSGQ